ncbi:NCS2 family permease [Thiotrichales bacterium 19S3-7]|nr:NCS2 family permease [Thiotrichales bacterium 19S3-7]MCF6802972.1 NCS2 family permease [Thiotrichales bacterium 19S3-11]
MQLIARYFNFNHEQTSFRTEIIAGLTSFLAVMYIIIVNSKILSLAGMPFNALVTSTVIISAFATIAMGIYAKNPYVLAPGMGMNAFFTFTIVKLWNIPWQTALGAVLWSGIIFLLLAIFNIRTKIIQAVPKSIQNSLGAGIGLFIALIGLKNAEIIVPSDATLIKFGHFSPPFFIFLISFLLLVILTVKNIKGSMIISIIFATAISLAFGRVFDTSMPVLVSLPDHIFSSPDFSLFFQLDLWGALKLSIVPVILTFLFINIFDSSGTLIGLANSTNWIDKKGEPLRMRQSLLVDSAASSISGIIGVSPATVFIESASGIAAGGRSGLTAVIAGILFLPFMFLAPLINMVPLSAVAPILVLVGCYMMRSIINVNWDNIEDAIPAFLTATLIPFGFSISEGVAWGMVAWFAITLVQDKKQISLMSLFITICCILIIINNMA